MIDTDKEKELEAKLADLKARWPAHSVPIWMWQELERLEEKLESTKRDKLTGK
ncbi:histidine kinase [Chloroflexota bacterium]